jgi:hypothetical protein
LGAALLVALILIVALASGWNNPRPSGPPDWRAPDLPRLLAAPPGDTTLEQLSCPLTSEAPASRGFVLEGILAPAPGPEFNGYGLAYGLQDTTHYSVFALGSDGYYAVLRVSGDVETPVVTWQQFPHIRRGSQANRLRIECSGSTCDFHINDEYATSAEAGPALQGDCGLWVRSFEDEPIEVEFTSLAVWVDD